MKNLYESVIIFTGDLTEKQYKYRVNKYKGIVASLPKDTEITSIDRLGEKSLAYEIKSHKTGWYVIFRFKTEVENISELERQLRIDDDVMKFITVKMGEDETEEDEMEDEDDEESIVESEQHPEIIDYWDVAFGLLDNNKK